MSVTRRDFVEGLCALVGTAAAVRFCVQLEVLAQNLSGPQEWALGFDGAGVEQLVKNGLRVDGSFVENHGCFLLTGDIVFSPSDFWALTILTDPDGGEWRTVDGETWTQGEMVL